MKEVDYTCVSCYFNDNGKCSIHKENGMFRSVKKSVSEFNEACNEYYHSKYLSKEIAITWHRKMWNWIADNIEEIKPNNIEQIKKIFIRNYQIPRVYLHCFLCEYTEQHFDSSCSKCPVKWVDIKGKRVSCCYDGNDYLFSKIGKTIATDRDYKAASEIARMIASLKEEDD